MKTTRDEMTRKLTTLCARLYSAKTSQAERRALSLEVSILRSRMMRTRDPLAAMMRASQTDDEVAA